MPELSLHFAVTFALVAPVLGLRKAAVVAFISLLPDLDFLFYLHRSISHSIIILLAVSLVALSFVRRLKPSLFSLTLAGCLSLLAHPIMDIFAGPTPLLWPVVQESVSMTVNVAVVAEGSLRFSWTFLVKWLPVPVSPTPVAQGAMVGPIFTNEGFMVSLLLVAVPILVVLLRQKNVRAQLC